MARPATRADGVECADERELLARVACGERAAFAALYRVYAPRLRAFLARASRDRTSLQEVLDDTMLTVWRKAGSYSATCAVSTWIFAIAYRKALKAAARERCAPASLALAHDERACAGPEAELQREEIARRVGAALTHLSSTHHAVLRLVYFHGYACREAAGILRCPVDTVKTRMFHARRRMRALLASMEPGR